MITIPAVSALVSVSVQLYKCICLGKSCKKSGIFYYFCRQIQGGRGSRAPLRFFCIFLKPSRISDRKSFYWSYFLGSSSPTKQWKLCGIRAVPKQNQNSGLKEAGVFFQKMKNDITLRGDTSSQLDFNLAPQDIVLNCSDGQVRSIFVACQLNWNFCIKGGDELSFVGSHLALHTTAFAGIQ